LIDYAQNIYFLGFSYDKTNLKVLNILNHMEKTLDGGTFLKRPMGTVYNLGDSEINNITNYFNGRIMLGNKFQKTLDFLKNHVTFK